MWRIAIPLFAIFAPERATAQFSPYGFLDEIDLVPHNPLGILDVGLLLCRIADAIFWIALIAAVLAFLVAAFFYLTSGGDEKKVTRARSTFVYVVYGVAIAILAWGAAFVLASLFTGGGASFEFDPCP